MRGSVAAVVYYVSDYFDWNLSRYGSADDGSLYIYIVKVGNVEK